ncbi:uncharacterized protein PV09_05998 [Verruconis gallopava]|uniref:Major facilitator superfamily (MFS) profile domain-containing protein n=1 Tax=Verruconis gallopava TaxID=253628 RepID=A0A0D1YPJ3_9PEZI|nr:uncharacterized protein PV09_05998 [Verruconis gallopava]KIW02542.1 hypothetical protein PV09_05998 [Verruconis gallopava]
MTDLKQKIGEVNIEQTYVAACSVVENSQDRCKTGEGISMPAEEQPNMETSYITGIKLWSMLASLVLVFFLLLLDMSIVATAIPKITSQFHSLHDVGWYGSAYLLSNCVLQPLTGKIYVRFSTKRTFIAFFGLFEFGSLVCGLSQSSKMLITGRAIAGMGSSGLMNGGIQMCYLAIPAHRRPMIMGVLMSCSQLGVLCGPLLGGLLTEYSSWRWCFYINLPIGALATIAMVFVNVPKALTKEMATNVEDQKSRIKFLLYDLDIAGFALFASFSVMVVLALQWGGVDYAWSSATIIGLFVGGGCSLLIFAVHQYRLGDSAMFPWSVVRQRVVWSSMVTMFFFFGSQIIGNYFLPIYFQTIRNASPAMSGVYTLPSIFSMMAASVGSGALLSRWGYYLPWVMASAILAAVGNGLLSSLGLHTSTVRWVWYQIILGFGRGCGMQMTIVAVQTNLPPTTVPIGQAMIIFEQYFGGALFLAIAQALFNGKLDMGLTEYAPHVDAQSVIHAGASRVRDIVSSDDLSGVLLAYSKAINSNFYLAAACSAVTVLTGLGMGWRKVERNKSAKHARATTGKSEATDK